MKKKYWTKETLPTLIGRRNGQLTVRAVGEPAEPLRLTVLETECSCGGKRQISWAGFTTSHRLACKECLLRRKTLAQKRARAQAREETRERRQKAQAVEPVTTGRGLAAYMALSVEHRELVDLIVGSRRYVTPEPGFRDRVLAEAIEIVRLETPEAIRAEYAPDTRRIHTDLYEARRYDI